MEGDAAAKRKSSEAANEHQDQAMPKQTEEIATKRNETEEGNPDGRKKKQKTAGKDIEVIPDEEKQEELDDAKVEIMTIWQGATDAKKLNEAADRTMNILKKHVDSVIRAGLEGFHRWEKAAGELKVLQEEVKGKDIELDRLRAAEEKNFKTISNLLRAVDKSQTAARDSSQNAAREAGLRAELSVMTEKRDEALGQAEEHKRKSSLLQDELKDVKIKLSCVTQEKLKMERDQRVAASLAKNLENHVSSDVDYYKRRVTDLSGHIQGMNAVVAEKNRQIEDMRRQIERNMSQHRLANLLR